MAKSSTPTRKQERRRLPLTARLSLLVLLAALLPLGAVVAINDYSARATLVENGRSALTTDARAKVDLINTYLRERAADGVALATLPTTPALLGCVAMPGFPPSVATQLNIALKCDEPTQVDFYKGSNCRAVRVGIARDPNYTVWGLYDARGDQLLTSANETCAPTANSTVPKEDLAPIQQNKQWISAVYTDSQKKHAFVQLYTPVALQVGPNKVVVGFLRAALNLDYIWNIVKGEAGANGSGSSAFLADENGVRIADANPDNLFTAIKPLDPTTQQLISSEQRFGTKDPVAQKNLPGVATSFSSTTAEDSFQSPATPGSNTDYEFVRIHLQSAPWTYFVLSPLSTVTAVADSQVRVSLLSAGVIAILAILFGLVLGRGLAQPVQRASGNLEGAALALKSLASRQQNSAGEQQWVVDACRTGLDSVRYLSDAMNQAARRIIDASNWFSEYWDRLTEEQARRTVQHLLELARYIDEAARRQQAAGERMGKAINVTMQVTDQLVAGATAATQSADQLDRVVGNLQRVVGGRYRVSETAPDDLQDQDDFRQMAQASQMGYDGQSSALVPVGPAPMRGAHSDRLAMQPVAPGQHQRQMGGPGMPVPGGMPQGQPMQQQHWQAAAPRAPRGPWNANAPSQVFDDGGQGGFNSNPNWNPNWSGPSGGPARGW
ncbi:MAG: hypothetical protein ACXWQ5_01115 [Ktedonobacterales bacterium]